MNEQAMKKTEVVEDTNILPFKLAKEPPKGDDWLSKLEAGTVFLVRPKGKWPWNVMEWVVVEANKDLTCRLLQQNIGDGTNQWVWVVPTIYCATFDFVEIIKDNNRE